MGGPRGQEDVYRKLTKEEVTLALKVTLQSPAIGKRKAAKATGDSQVETPRTKFKVMTSSMDDDDVDDFQGSDGDSVGIPQKPPSLCFQTKRMQAGQHRKGQVGVQERL